MKLNSGSNETTVGKYGNFKMQKALKKCYKKTNFLEKIKKKG